MRRARRKRSLSADLEVSDVFWGRNSGDATNGSVVDASREPSRSNTSWSSIGDSHIYFRGQKVERSGASACALDAHERLTG